MSFVDIYENYSGRIEEIAHTLKRNVQELAFQGKTNRSYYSPYEATKWEKKILKLRARFHYYRGGLKMFLGEKLFMHELFIDGEHERILGLLNLEGPTMRHREITLEDILAEEIIEDRPMFRSTVKPTSIHNN